MHRTSHLLLLHEECPYLGSTLSGLSSSLQPCLASMARLNVWRSLNPNPPSFLNLAIFSADSQWIFWSSSCCAQKNLQIIAVICSHSPFVRSNTDIAKIGIAWAHAFIRISFSALVSSFSSHPCIQRQILSFKYVNTLVLDWPT